MLTRNAARAQRYAVTSDDLSGCRKDVGQRVDRGRWSALKLNSASRAKRRQDWATSEGREILDAADRVIGRLEAGNDERPYGTVGAKSTDCSVDESFEPVSGCAPLCAEDAVVRGSLTCRTVPSGW